MAITGSIIGILGSAIWVYLGTFILGGWIEEGKQTSSQLSDQAMIVGFLIAFVQSIITISFFIVTLVKSTPENLDNALRNTGKWFLIVGIGIALINFFQLLPSILLIMAGAFSIRRDGGTGSLSLLNKINLKWKQTSTHK